MEKKEKDGEERERWRRKRKRDNKENGEKMENNKFVEDLLYLSNCPFLFG